MNILGQLALQTGSALIKGNPGAFGLNYDKKQLEQQKKLQDLQIKGNKQMIDYSSEMQRKMWEYTNYGNQRKQMERAGLNPALMYQQAGAGVTGTASGNVSGGNSSDASSRQLADIQSQGMALQLAKLASEIDVNKSVAEVNRANADLSGAKTNATWQEVEKLIVDTEMAKDLAWITKIDADFAYEYKRVLTDKLIGEKNITMEQKDNIKKSTELLSDNMRKIDQEIENLKTQNNLNEEQIKAVKAGVLETFGKISLMSKQEIATTYTGEETRLNNILLKDVTDHIGGSTMQIGKLSLPFITTILKSLIEKSR